MHVDLTDLRLFLGVLEAGSITRGAERAGMALASASERVRGMERDLGAPLLMRGSRGVAPTPAGHALARHARAILLQAERMSAELAEHAAGLKGRVRLLTNTAALTEFLPEALAAFLTAHPNLDVEVEERPSLAIVAALRDGSAEMGLVSDAVEVEGLASFPLRQDRLVAALPPGHALAARRNIRFADILADDHVGLSAGSALQDYLARQAARHGAVLKLRIRLKGFDAICRMVERGVGIGVVPESALRRCGGAAVGVPLADDWACRRLTLCARDPASLPPVARRLFESLLGAPYSAVSRNCAPTAPL